MSRKNKIQINGGFIVLPKHTIRGNDYKTLKPYSRAVYITMLTEFIRDNKQNPLNLLKMSHNQIEVLSGLKHSTIVLAIRQLKAKEFIRVHEPGGLEHNPNVWQLNGRYLNTGVGASW